MRFLDGLKYLLAPLSLIYLLLTAIRNIFYELNILKQNNAGAKVISVGNITWGGTGKTPVVLFISQGLLKYGKKVAILIRGYGKDEKRFLVKSSSKALVIAGRDRVKAAQSAIKQFSADTLLLDDGFQYRKLKRDLEIVCIDATNPFGNGWVIPVGCLREGLFGLKRADIFLITRVDQVRDRRLRYLERKLKRINPGAEIVKSIHKSEGLYNLFDGKDVQDIKNLKGRHIVLLSAIGNPVAFEKTIAGLGLDCKRHFIFRDHHWYKSKELRRIERYCARNGIVVIITTEKDAAKTPLISYPWSLVAKILVLKIRLRIVENEEGFYNRLLGIYSS